MQVVEWHSTDSERRKVQKQTVKFLHSNFLSFKIEISYGLNGGFKCPGKKKEATKE